MSDRTPKRRLPRGAAPVARSPIPMRPPDDLGDWLEAASERLGLSRNVLMVAAVEQLRRVLDRVDAADASNDPPEDVVEDIGPGWASGLMSAGLRNERLRVGYAQWLADVEHARRESAGERAARRLERGRKGADNGSH